MKYQPLQKNNKGAMNVIVIVVVVAVLAAIGFVGWRVMQNKSDEPLTKAAKEVLAKCEEDDKDLCKFFANSVGSKKFSITSTATSGGNTTKSIIKIDNGKTYMKTEGELAYEVISIGDSTYTKAGDTWYKQTAKKTEDKPVKAEDYTFEEPKKEENAPKTTYEKQGKEACGNLTCFKYKVVDPSNTDTTEYIWFDDQDFLARKTRSESKDGSVNEAVYSYENVSVTEPSPVKELGANQYIVPGQTEPQTMPDVSNMNEYMPQ